MSSGNAGTQTKARALLVAFGLLAALLPIASVEAQATPGIVINEIFYHPPCTVNFTPCADAPAEFVELYNASDQTVDITHWALSDAVTLPFPLTTTIGAGEYLVIADDADGFASFFGFAPDAVWSGKLSNSGERLALIDPAGVVVDEVTYSDGSAIPGAWSVGADGDGESLSLLSATDDDGTSRWWDAATPTPARVNANDGQTPAATVADFSWTVLPSQDEDLAVSAEIYGGQNVALQYRIGYPGNNQLLPMQNDAGNTWTTTIPADAYSAGDLVRFRLFNDGDRIAPRTDDSIKWVGTTVADPSVNSDLPVMEWFTTTSNYNSGFNESGDTLHDGVLAYDGKVWDNLGFRARGAIARSSAWSKRNWKFKMPDHHDFFIEGIDYGLDSIDLQGGFADEARIREFVGHTVADQMGLVASQVQHVHLRLNGEFFGLHTLQEHPEGGFLKDNDLDNATLYKSVSLDYEAGPNVTPARSVDWETWDIPEYINLLAAASVIQNNDFAHNNFYSWYDADEHERIEGMVWDLDLSQGVRYAPNDGLTVTLIGSTRSYVWGRWIQQAAIFNQGLSAPYRELYLRRLRTLADEWFGTGRYEQVARDAFADITGANGGVNEWALDTERWGFWGGQNYGQQNAINRHSDQWIDQYYSHITSGGPNGDIPGPQPTNPNIDLIVDANPSDPRRERIEIRNNEATAIDLSGWRLSGSTTFTLAPGSVLPSNGSAYVVSDDTKDGYRAATNNHYVLGEYPAPLNDAGGAIALSNIRGQQQATAEWGDGAPPSGLILNEWNAVSSSRLLADGDTRLGSIVGNGGDWFELVTVEDNLDIRGWTLEIMDNGTLNRTLTFADQELFADLRAGTIITIAENPITAEDGTVYDQDISYDPPAGDWWIHLTAGSAGTGTHIDAENFAVSDDDWQLTIYDQAATRRFGPAGEGIGTLSGGGVNNFEIGELEADPSLDIIPSAPYDDGTQSTFGQPNDFNARAQDFDALRPDVGPPPPNGDVNCDGEFNIADAYDVARFSVSLITDSGGCPRASFNEIYAAAGDLTYDDTTNILDSSVIARCVVGLEDPNCPDR